MTSTLEIHKCYNIPLIRVVVWHRHTPTPPSLLCLLQVPGVIQQLTRNRKMTCKHHFVCSFLRIKWCRRHYQIWWNDGSVRKRSLWTSAWLSQQMMKDYQMGNVKGFSGLESIWTNQYRWSFFRVWSLRKMSRLSVTQHSTVLIIFCQSVKRIVY